MSPRSIVRTGVSAALFAFTCGCSLLVSNEAQVDTVEMRCGDIAPTVVLDRFAEPQILHIDALELSEDVAPQLEAQAAKHSFAASEVASKLKTSTAGATQELTKLATRLPDVTVLENAEASRERATLRITGCVDKLDLVASNDITRVIGQGSGLDRSSKVDFRAQVTLRLVKDGAVIATGTSTSNVPCHTERATEGQTAATPKAPATGAGNLSREDLVLSPMKDSVAFAVDGAWGDLWRSVAASTVRRSSAAVPASAPAAKTAPKP